MDTAGCTVNVPLEAASTDDFPAGEGAEDARDDLKRGIIIRLLQSFVLRDLLSSSSNDDWSTQLDKRWWNLLSHVQLCCALLVPAELHYQVLVACLALTNGCAEAKLERKM